MSNCAIVGINWGDEGKGRMVDYFASQFDVVIRYQGGNNAGHTVINEYGKNALNLLPSGIFRRETLNLLGAGVVVDLKHLTEEIGRLRAEGVHISPENLKISDRAIMVLPIHPLQDKWEELRLGKDSFGINGCHSEKCNNPHPEYCTGSSYKYRSAGADYVACSDLRRNRCCKCLER